MGRGDNGTGAGRGGNGSTKPSQRKRPEKVSSKGNGRSKPKTSSPGPTSRGNLKPGAHQPRTDQTVASGGLAERKAATVEPLPDGSVRIVPGTTPWRQQPSRAEVLERLRIVEGLMLQGLLGRDVQRALEIQYKATIPWWVVSKYIRHVAQMWEEEDAIARPYRRARQLRQLYDAAAELREGKQWGDWIALQRIIARIEGNEAPIQHEVRVRTRFEGWSIEELEAYAETGHVPEGRQGHAGHGPSPFDAGVPEQGEG